jgi:hypothetical protein
MCSYRKADSHATVLPKHPLKIHVWAAINKRGASHIRLFAGIMGSEFYTDCKLRDTLAPFIEEIFGGNQISARERPKTNIKTYQNVYG